jgi:hypothetical protein
MPHLETKRPRARADAPPAPRSRRKPENLVAEIVDQITEKQARSAELEAEKPRPTPVRAEPAGSPYQAVLSCSTEEPGSP